MSDENETALSDLEKEYKENFDYRSKQIEAEVELAKKHLDKAVELSEKYGIPIDSDINYLCGNAYVPESLMDGEFSEVWENEDLKDQYGFYAEWAGWQHSSVC